MAGYTRQHHYLRVGHTVVSTEYQILKKENNESWFTQDKFERINMMIEDYLINQVTNGFTHDDLYFAEDDSLAIICHIFKKNKTDFVLTRKKMNNLQDSNGGNFVGYFEFPHTLVITVNQKRSFENRVLENKEIKNKELENKELENKEIKCIESYSKIMESDEDENIFCPPPPSNFASTLTVSDVVKIVQSLEKDINGIFNGEVKCRRHEAFFRGGEDKAYLRMESCNNVLTEEHQDAICHHLLKMFCAKKSKHFDYIMKVLLPESIIMFYAKVLNISIEEARNIISSM